PTGILESDKAASARLVAGKQLHLVEENRVLQRHGKGFPTGFGNAAVESRRIAKLRIDFGQLFPKRPAAAILLGQLFGRARHRTEARCVGHRGILEKHQVISAHRNRLDLAAVASPYLDRLHGNLTGLGSQVEISNKTASLEIDALFRKPGLKWSNQRVEVIEDRAFDSRQRFNSREFIHE